MAWRGMETVMILAIDPGSEQSAYVLYDPTIAWIGLFGILSNGEMCDTLQSVIAAPASILVIEQIGHYGTGMPAGKTVFDTCIWIGRFLQAWDGPYELVPVKTWRAQLCGSARAKDGNARQALIDRFGAPGTKKNPGKLYGVKKDVWQALGLAVAYGDTHDVVVYDSGS